MREIHCIHDKTFKSAMANIKVAQDFFNTYLPQSIRSLADLSTLKLNQNSYIDESLNSSSSDVLYEVKLQSNDTGYFSMLCEHQSSVDELMPYRLWSYMVRIWADHYR